MNKLLNAPSQTLAAPALPSTEQPAARPEYRAPRIETRSWENLRDLLASVRAATGFIPSP
jgi:hypothetical protein